MQDDEKADGFIQGRGAQINTYNKFRKTEYVTEHIEMLDEPLLSSTKTKVFYEYPANIVNKVDSPDVGMMYSANPYQGCEHGCIYCYARNSHQYWGYSAGLDFESKIIVKPEAPKLVEQTLRKRSWKPAVISLSGNTDCYQPLERKYRLTRQILEVLLRFRNPVGIITKNALILRDLDILKELASLKLVHVMVSITSLEEDLRLLLEPRTATAKQRLKVIEQLTLNGIPAGVMTAPIIPGLNSMEIPAIIKAASDAGAVNAGYTMVRLNGAIGDIFTDWINKAMPDRAEKVLNQIREVHGGTLNDSRWGTRMKGEGNIASIVKQMFSQSVKKHLAGRSSYEYDYSLFKVPSEGGQLDLF